MFWSYLAVLLQRDQNGILAFAVKVVHERRLQFDADIGVLVAVKDGIMLGAAMLTIAAAAKRM
jgi:hypothetical protein